MATARKWKSREDAQDRWHRPHRLSTTLTPAQELLVVELRRTLLLPLDDLLAMIREFINGEVSRSGLDRCLRRHGVSDLKSLQPQIEGQPKPLKTFKDYEPGFLHIDTKYLPQMPDETYRRYLFVAIDRATRWVFMRTYRDQTDRSSTDFLPRLKGVALMKIRPSSPTTAASSPTDSRAPPSLLLVSMYSTWHASPWAYSTACARRDTPRPTAWSSVSTAASARSSVKPDSPQRPIWTPRSSTICQPTTTSFPSERSSTKRRFRRYKLGNSPNQTYSSSGFSNKRDLTGPRWAVIAGPGAATTEGAERKAGCPLVHGDRSLPGSCDSADTVVPASLRERPLTSAGGIASALSRHAGTGAHRHRSSQGTGAQGMPGRLPDGDLPSHRAARLSTVQTRRCEAQEDAKNSILMVTRHIQPSVKKKEPSEFFEFTVDAALLKELGERLVGKPHIALAELVKNAYDADATKVRITFEPDAIEVADNGDGMSKAEFQQFWMRVGTTHKQDSPVTPLFKRKVSGSKGVGRLSVQFLGNSLSLWSVSRTSTSVAFRAEVDWRKAQRSASLVKSGANVFRSSTNGILPDDFSHGTRLRIEGLNQTWDAEGLRNLARELWFLRPPKPLGNRIEQKDRFDIELEGAAEEERAAFDAQLDKAFKSWIAEIRGSIKGGRKKRSATVTVTFSDGLTDTKSYPLPSAALDQADFQIRVYKLSGKQAGGISVGEARDYFRRFGGVHIYDQDFRLPFYGGEGEDWLRLEYDHSHRLMVSKLVPEELKGKGDLRDLPTNGRIFGIVRVSTSHERVAAPEADRAKGTYLNIQVTRDRFIDNNSMSDLRELIRWGLDYYSYLASAKKYRVSNPGGAEPFKPTEPVFDELRQRLADLRSDVPPQAVVQLERIGSQVEELFDLEQRREQRFHRERVLLGALATAGMGAIALEHELGKELTALRNAIDGLASIEASPGVAKVKKALQALMTRITDARKLLSPLMEPENRDHVAAMKIKPLVDGIVGDLRPLLRSMKVDTNDVDPEVRLPAATRAAWMAILQNVIVNAMNATIETSSKRIRIWTRHEPGQRRASLRVEDSGVGVDLDDADELFEPFERKLELSPDRKRLGLGGVGLGLTIVRMVAESVECQVRFVEPSDGMSTAFELSWKVDDANTPPSNPHRRRRA